jgi:hypothetical protein
MKRGITQCFNCKMTGGFLYNGTASNAFVAHQAMVKTLEIAFTMSMVDRGL